MYSIGTQLALIKWHRRTMWKVTTLMLHIFVTQQHQKLMPFVHQSHLHGFHIPALLRHQVRRPPLVHDPIRKWTASAAKPRKPGATLLGLGSFWPQMGMVQPAQSYDQIIWVAKIYKTTPQNKYSMLYLYQRVRCFRLCPRCHILQRPFAQKRLLWKSCNKWRNFCTHMNSGKIWFTKVPKLGKSETRTGVLYFLCFLHVPWDVLFLLFFFTLAASKT